MGLGRPPPDPGSGMPIEVIGGAPRDIRDIVVIGQRRPGEGFAPEDPPPPFNQIQPGRADRNEGLPNARMGFQPRADRATGVAGEVVGNQIEIPCRVGAVQRLQQVEVATGVARRSGLSSGPDHRGSAALPTPRPSAARGQS
jgi:hypothetical protein